MTPTYAEIARDGLWRNNAGLVQLLGLCPLLAVSNSVVNGLGLGLATTAVLVGSNVVVSFSRPMLRREIRIPAYVLIIASLVTAVDLWMQAVLFDLHRVLGIFIPLIVTNCAIIGRAEAFAARHDPRLALADALATGAGFTGVLVALGAMRELVGFGTLFRQAHMLFGEAGRALELQIFDGGFLLAVLPPGAFIGLGLLIAAKNVIEQRATRSPKPAEADAAATPATG